MVCECWKIPYILQSMSMFEVQSVQFSVSFDVEEVNSSKA